MELGWTIGAPIGGAIGASLVSDAVTGKDAFASIPFWNKEKDH